MARIKHPRFQPGRTRGLAGIEFIDGYAEVELEGNTHLAQALAQHGYTVEEAEAPFEPLPDAVEGDTAERVSKPSKRSGKGKPAKAAKAPEPSNGAVTEGDSAVIGSAERAEAALDAQFAPED